MIQQVLQLMRTEVGNANVSSLVLRQEQRHGAPGVNVIDVLAAEPAVLDRPVHVVQVEVADAEVLERVVDGCFDSVGVVSAAANVRWQPRMHARAHSRIVPQFAGDPQIFPLQAGRCQSLGDASSNIVLVAVCFGAVDVPVALLDCVGDSLGAILLEIPGAET